MSFRPLLRWLARRQAKADPSVVKEGVGVHRYDWFAIPGLVSYFVVVDGSPVAWFDSDSYQGNDHRLAQTAAVEYARAL